MTTRPPALSAPRIALMGPYGYGNLGDAAIQEAMIQNIRKRFPGAEIHGISLNPEDTRRRHNIPCFPIQPMARPAGGLQARLPASIRYHAVVRSLVYLFSRVPREIGLAVEATRYLRGFDFLIASGGGQLDDYWGGARGHPFALMKWGVIARYVGTPYLFVSVGAGPIQSAWSQRFIKRALALASYRSYRDASSRELIQSLGFIADDPVYPDLAFSLDLAAPAPPDNPKVGKAVVGVGPMAYFDPRVWPQKDAAVYQGYLARLAEIVAWLVRRGHDVVLFPGEIVQDRAPTDDLKKMLSAKLTPSELACIHDEPVETVEGLLAQLARTDLVIASRFHGVLLAQLLLKPVLALSYHPKIDRLMEETGQADYCLPVDNFKVETALERFQRLEANAAAVRDVLAAKVRGFRSALDEQYERIFASPRS